MTYLHKIFKAVLVIILSMDLWAQAPVSFHSASKYAVGTSPSAATSADFNGDGKMDLAVANSGSKNVSILLGKGDGSFQTAINSDLGNSDASVPISIAAGDFNGDGKDDVAVFLQRPQTRLGARSAC
jgi:hypothetical protein